MVLKFAPSTSQSATPAPTCMPQPQPQPPLPTPTLSGPFVLSVDGARCHPDGIQLLQRGTPVWATAGRGTGWWPAVVGGYKGNSSAPKPDRLRVRFLDNHLNRTVADVKATQMEAWDTGLASNRARLQVLIGKCARAVHLHPCIEVGE